MLQHLSIAKLGELINALLLQRNPPMKPSKAELLAIAEQLETYVDECHDARYYGGPTIYPTSPFSEKWATDTAKVIRAALPDEPAPSHSVTYNDDGTFDLNVAPSPTKPEGLECPAEYAHPFFVYDFMPQKIMFKSERGDDTMALDVLSVRGWGHLIGHGQAGLKINEQAAAEIQDNFGRWVAKTLTTALSPVSDASDTVRVKRADAELMKAFLEHPIPNTETAKPLREMYVRLRASLNGGVL
jgi:hypothetical protein